MKTLRHIQPLLLISLLSLFPDPLPAADATAPLAGEGVVFEEVDGLVAIEAEHFYKQTLQDKRAWHITSAKNAPDLKPDADPATWPARAAGRISKSCRIRVPRMATS